MLKNEPTPNKTLTTEERREEIKKAITELGLWNINKSFLAKKYDVSRDTIYRDFKVILSQLSKEDLLKIRVELSGSLKKAEKEVRKILANPNTSNKEKMEACDRICKISECLTKHLEAYGIKEKVPERHEITQRAGIIKAVNILNKLKYNGTGRISLDEDYN